jgi:hypothetical protein
VIRQPQFTWKGPPAIDANPIVPGPVFIPSAVAITLQLELDVDMAPNVLLHPARGVPIHVIDDLVIHILHT